jgi:hypothetical protein
MKSCPHCGAGWLMHGTLQPAGVPIIICEEEDCMWFDLDDVDECGFTRPGVLEDALGPAVVALASVSYDRYVEVDDDAPGPRSLKRRQPPEVVNGICPVCRMGILQSVYLAHWARGGWACRSCQAFWFHREDVHWCSYLRLDRLLTAFGLEGSTVIPMLLHPPE